MSSICCGCGYCTNVGVDHVGGVEDTRRSGCRKGRIPPVTVKVEASEDTQMRPSAPPATPTHRMDTSLVKQVYTQPHINRMLQASDSLYWQENIESSLGEYVDEFFHHLLYSQRGACFTSYKSEAEGPAGNYHTPTFTNNTTLFSREH